MSSDPIGIWGDGGNLGNQYAYGWLRPTAVVDRYGEAGWGWLTALAGAAIGAVVGVVVEAVASKIQGRDANYVDAAISGAVAGGTMGAMVDPATATLVTVMRAGALSGAAGEAARQAWNGEVDGKKMLAAMAGGAVGGAVGHGLAKAVPVVVDAVKKVGAATASGGSAPGQAVAKGAAEVVEKAAAPVVPNPCPVRTVGQMSNTPAESAVRAGSGAPKPVDLTLKYKDGWTAAQRAAADQKAAALTKATTTVTKNPLRSGTAQRRYRKAAGLGKGVDADHLVDLQLGGADNLANMWGLDQSVNRSLGAQIANAIADLPEGTVIGAVRMID